MNESIRHARLRADLKAFADRELPLLARFAVAQHLRGCSLCREELHQMQTLSNELNETEAESQPLAPELRAHILDQVPEQKAISDEVARRRQRVARKKMVLALGTASIVGLIGFSTLQSANTPQRFATSGDSMSTSNERTSGSDKAISANGGHDSSVIMGAADSNGSSTSTTTARAASSASQNNLFADGHVKRLPQSSAKMAENEAQRRAVVDQTSASSSAGAANESRLASNSVDTFARLDGAATSTANGSDALSVVPQSRTVHREGSLTVAVQNAEVASDNATAIIKNVGGFVAQTSLETGAGQKRTATLDCRVPVEKFEIVVSKIGQLGSVRAKSLSGQDITAQVAGSAARRRALSEELSIAQARLEKIEGAKKRDQYQIAQSRADVRAVRLQAAQARAQLETLQKYGSLSSLYVSLQDGVPVAKTSGAPGSLSPATNAAWESFLSNARLPLQLMLWILAYSPIWLPALLLWRKYGRKWLEA